MERDHFPRAFLAMPRLSLGRCQRSNDGAQILFETHPMPPSLKDARVRVLERVMNLVSAR